MRRLAKLFAGTRRRIAEGLSKAGISPLHLTVAGFLASFASGFLFYRGLFRWAAAILVLSGLLDLFDGEVARVSGRVTRFGAFLDSTLDRFSDAAVLGGIMLYYSSQGADRYVVLALVALSGSYLTSYARARAESLIDRCDVGIFERPERVVVLALAGLAGRVPAALWILAFATNITVLQRIIHVKLALGKADGPTRTDGEDCE